MTRHKEETFEERVAREREEAGIQDPAEQGGYVADDEVHYRRRQVEPTATETATEDEGILEDPGE